MIVSCYSPTDARGESDITNFHNGLSSLTRHIHKPNVLITDGDMNAEISKGGNYKFGLNNQPNKNGEYLRFFTYLSTKLKKEKQREINDLHPH